MNGKSNDDMQLGVKRGMVKVVPYQPEWQQLNLKTHPDSVAAYDSLKRQLSEQYGHDRGNYTKGKEQFIRHILSNPFL